MWRVALGGPALRVAARTGCSVVGVEVHEQAIATANGLAGEQGLAQVAEFLVADAAVHLPFPDGRL
jgi:O-methyltransferase StaMB